MRHLKTFLAVIGAAVILVLAGNTVALAANGKGFLLGKTNTATKMTTLSRTTSGTPLNLRSKSAANAPLAVNGTGKVANLNADRIDGLDSSALTTTPYVFTLVKPEASGSVDITAAVPPGTYLFSYSAFLSSTSPDLGSARCYVVVVNSPDTLFAGEANVSPAGRSYIGLSGSGLAVKKSAAGSISLHCDAGAAFKTAFGSAQPIQFVLTPVNGSRASAARLAAPSARTTK